MITILAKLNNGAISYAPRKIITDGKTIFNPSESLLKLQGYMEMEHTDAPTIQTQTQQAVPSWQEQDGKIVQGWEVRPAQPDPSVALQEIQTQAVIEQIKSSEDKTLGIQCMSFFDVWTAGNYEIGDIRTDPETGYPYECILAHDSSVNTDWTISVRTLWKPWHSCKPEYALPYEQPTGAHDMYLAGEYMIWTDGSVKKCIQDTNYSPDEYAAAWEDIV